MKFNIKFHPLLFQASLAAGGVALMPFNYLQFAIPHGKGLIKLSDIAWNALSGVEIALYFPLVAIMMISTIVHLILTFVFLKGLVSWVRNKSELDAFMSDSYKNVGIFPIIASLAMSTNVFWGPIGFFIPQISANLQALMLPSLILFGILWFFLLKLEFKVIKTWLKDSVDMRKFSFVWLLDVFAFGLVNLTGTGIAAMSGSKVIAGIAAIASLITLSIGLFLLIIKLVFLIYHQMKKEGLPDNPVLPAFFLVLPIACLYGLSFYRIAMYLQNYFSIDLKGASFFIVNFSYGITIAWGLYTLYMLSDYFKNYFIKSDFSPPQWGMV
ncbi:MAG: hypothetical protein K0Q99_256 [Clostridia bacterium]|nr:hypothetical protein [Clostridia bacterium]